MLLNQYNMRKLIISAVVLMSVGFAQTASAQRGITVYAKGSDAPIAEAAFTQVKSLTFQMPSVVMIATDDSELQTLDIKKLDRIVITEDVATDIKEVNENVNENVYNVAGQKVNGSYRGIVIKNGKKFIVTPKN